MIDSLFLSERSEQDDDEEDVDVFGEPSDLSISSCSSILIEIGLIIEASSAFDCILPMFVFVGDINEVIAS